MGIGIGKMNIKIEVIFIDDLTEFNYTQKLSLDSVTLSRIKSSYSEDAGIWRDNQFFPWSSIKHMTIKEIK